MLHKAVQLGDVHRIHNWEVADAAALAALSVTAADIGKVAWQLDTDNYKALKSNTGPVWITLNPAAVSSLAAAVISVADAGGYFTGSQVEAVLQEIGLALANLVSADTALDGRLDTLEGQTLDSRLDTIEAWARPYDIPLAAGDESTAITTGTKVTFIAIRAFSLDAIIGSLTTAQASGSIFTVDVKKNGASVFTTKLTIDNTELTSATAATSSVLTSTPLPVSVGDIFTIIVDQIGASGATGLKVYLKGHIA